MPSNRGLGASALLYSYLGGVNISLSDIYLDNDYLTRRNDVSNLNWIKVDSSAIASMAYKSSDKVLYVLFKKGSVYKYQNVSQYKYDKLTNAESKGKYLNDSIISDPTNHVATLLTKED